MRKQPEIAILLRSKGSRKAQRWDIVSYKRGGFRLRCGGIRFDLKAKSARAVGAEIGRMVAKLLRMTGAGAPRGMRSQGNISPGASDLPSRTAP